MMKQQTQDLGVDALFVGMSFVPGVEDGECRRENPANAQVVCMGGCLTQC